MLGRIDMDFSPPARPGRIKNIVGKKYALLTIVEFVGVKGNQAWYRCSCDCGNENFLVPGSNVTNGNTRSCGCLKHKPAVNRKSTEKFIEEARATHGDKFDYSEVVYIRARLPVIISCPIHGRFTQCPPDHLRTHGCPQCADRITAEKQTSNTDEFIERSILVHGEKYSYESVDYKTARIKVGITCKIHGVFYQYPYQHLVGVGCPHCAAKSNGDLKRGSVEKFIATAKEVHGDKYDYSRVVYTTARTPVEIFCNTHQTVFWQTPDNHTRGMNCPSCAKAGFSQALSGILYILQSPDYVKVGISNVSAEARARSVSKSAAQNFEVVKTYEMDGSICNTTETALLRWLRGFAKSPYYKFKGSTECFSVSVVDVINKAEELIYG
jgi:hypothetical protein